MPTPPLTPPTVPVASLPRRSGWARMWADLGRDARLVLPGFFISLAAVIILISLFALSVGTAPIWVGVLLLPVVLVVASGFADLSRARVREWGAPIAEVVRRPRGPGLTGWLSIVAGGRRWADLLFETVFALPVRILTFSFAVSWFAGGLGGLTYFFWGRFLPHDGSGLVNLTAAAWNRAPIVDYGFTAEASVQFAAGLVLLLTFPFILHALALLEVAAVSAGLTPVGGHSAEVDARVTSPGAGASARAGDTVTRVAQRARTGAAQRARAGAAAGKARPVM